MSQRKPPPPEVPKTAARSQSVQRVLAGPLCVALVATFAAVATLTPEQGGPGLGCDEPYHVAYGKRLVTALHKQGPRFFSPANIERNFDWRPGGPPVHPPLGNWVLGWVHHVFDPAPDDPLIFSIVSARFAPALAFGLLVFLIGASTARAEGPLAGTVAAAAVFFVPRAFGDAHMAALDMLTALSFVAAVLAVARADARGNRLRDYAIAGVVWGLAMLTRIHGLLVLPPVVVWMVWRLRRRVLLPLVVWCLAGLATLFAGWPWLWLDPIGRLQQFLGTATDRQSIEVFFAGKAWPDIGAPRSYAVVMFAATLPLGLLALGLLGLWARRRVSRGWPGYWLAMGSLVFALAAFSLPRAPVYDGVRLFLMVFPLWAVSVGIGAKWLFEHGGVSSWSPRLRVGVIGGLVLLQATGLVLYHPLYLSHYSLLVGGLAGAERLGFEVNYWGDSVSESLLREVASRAAGERVVLAPDLAPWQVPFVGGSSPSLIDGQVELVGWNKMQPALVTGCRYGIVYRRKANLADVPKALLDGEVVAEVGVMGVWAARLVALPKGWLSPSGAGRFGPPFRNEERQPAPPRRTTPGG